MHLGLLPVALMTLGLFFIYARLASNGLEGAGGKIGKILVAGGFIALILGLFITGFMKKPRVLLNIFNFLSAGCLAAAWLMGSLKGD